MQYSIKLWMVFIQDTFIFTATSIKVEGNDQSKTGACKNWKRERQSIKCGCRVLGSDKVRTTATISKEKEEKRREEIFIPSYQRKLEISLCGERGCVVCGSGERERTKGWKERDGLEWK